MIGYIRRLRYERILKRYLSRHWSIIADPMIPREARVSLFAVLVYGIEFVRSLIIKQKIGKHRREVAKLEDTAALVALAFVHILGNKKADAKLEWITSANYLTFNDDEILHSFFFGLTSLKKSGGQLPDLIRGYVEVLEKVVTDLLFEEELPEVQLRSAISIRLLFPALAAGIVKTRPTLDLSVP